MGWYKKQIITQRPLLDGDVDLCSDIVVAIAGPRRSIWLARVIGFEVEDSTSVKVQYIDAITPTGTYYKLLPNTNEVVHREAIICNGIPMRPIHYKDNGQYSWRWKVIII